MRNSLLLSVILILAAQYSFGQKTLLDLRFQQRDKKKAVRAPIVTTKRFYDHRGPIRKQAIRIQPLQLYNSLRVGYEMALFPKIALGALGTYHYRDQNAGTMKAEVYGKYFLTYRAPIGLYVFNSHGIARIANQTINYGLTEVGPEERFNYSRPYVLTQEASYSTYVGSVGIGFQNISGKRKNIIFDFGLGYQYYLMPDRFKTTQTQFNAVYSNFSPSNHILGPTSPLSFRVAVGYAF